LLNLLGNETNEDRKESAFNSLTKIGRPEVERRGKEGELFFSLQYPSEAPRWSPRDALE
jgi:hypothetical protein